MDKITPRNNQILIGHDTAQHILLDAWQSEKLHHAWLITGAYGIGKATLAWRFARFIMNGGNDDGNLFGNEPNSMEIVADNKISHRMAAGGHPDFLCLEKGMFNKANKKIAENDIPVAIIRDALNLMRLTPAEGKWRVIIIDAVDDLNRNAANALLKSLEEPPKNTIFLLISHAVDKLLPTIKSRCRRLNLQILDDDIIIKILQENYPEISIEQASLLAKISDGSIGKSIRLLDAGGIDLYGDIISIMQNAGNMDIEKLHKFASSLAIKNASNKFNIFREIIDWWLKRLIKIIAIDDDAAILPVKNNNGDQKISNLLTMEQSLINDLKMRGNLALWLELWENMTKLLAQIDAPYNLDKKQVIISAFMTFNAAMARINMAK